jgi:hypothetical protein
MKNLALASVLALSPAALGGCGLPTESPPPPPLPERIEYPDPPPIVADKIAETIVDWVEERSEEGIFDIPPRGGHDVAGALGEFHTVHQKDADTYTVCVDFIDGDIVYDVDFFVDRKIDGLKVRDAYLHKINGEVVSG